MKLLLTGAFNYTEEQLNSLRAGGFEITFVQDEREELTIDCSEFSAVVCNSLFQYTPVERFTSLKVVQLTSAGLNRVPVGYLASKGVALYNAKGVYSTPMAEWVVLKILEFYKNSSAFASQQKSKVWEKHRNLLELTDKRVLIVGTGSVGTECAKRLGAFDAHIIGADIFDSNSPFIDEFYHMEALTEVLPTADIVILTLPLTDTTRGLFSSTLLSTMKDESILINVARGAIIDEAALIEKLLEGKFMGVALDVFEEEPLSTESPLWTIDRVKVSPHNSFVSDGNSKRMFSLIYKNLTEFDFGKATR